MNKKNNKIRIDFFICKKNNLSRQKVEHLLKNNQILLNNKICSKKNTLINPEIDEIKINNILNNNKDKVHKILPLKIDLEIIYEDKYLLIANKPSNIITHSTNYEENNTFANIVKNYFDKNKIIYDFKDESRMGICHRLDKDTSGLIIIAKNQKILSLIQKLFQKNEIKKTYLALLNGNLENKIIDVDVPIKIIKGTSKYQVSQDYNAKNAFSTFELIKNYNHFCLVKISIKTGRTHQIRVHAKYIKHNILNDPVYGENKKQVTKYGQYLFANQLNFIHPITNKLIDVKIDMPGEFLYYIEKYGK